MPFSCRLHIQSSWGGYLTSGGGVHSAEITSSQSLGGTPFDWHIVPGPPICSHHHHHHSTKMAKWAPHWIGAEESSDSDEPSEFEDGDRKYKSDEEVSGNEV